MGNLKKKSRDEINWPFVQAMVIRFYSLSLNDFYSLSQRLVNQLIGQIPYVWDIAENESFGKPDVPRKKAKPKLSAEDLLAEAAAVGIKVPSRVKYQLRKAD